jgi:hypothetical protein
MGGLFDREVLPKLDAVDVSGWKLPTASGKISGANLGKAVEILETNLKSVNSFLQTQQDDLTGSFRDVKDKVNALAIANGRLDGLVGRPHGFGAEYGVALLGRMQPGRCLHEGLRRLLRGLGLMRDGGGGVILPQDFGRNGHEGPLELSIKSSGSGGAKKKGNHSLQEIGRFGRRQLTGGTDWCDQVGLQRRPDLSARGWG